MYPEVNNNSRAIRCCWALHTEEVGHSWVYDIISVHRVQKMNSTTSAVPSHLLPSPQLSLQPAVESLWRDYKDFLVASFCADEKKKEKEDKETSQGFHSKTLHKPQRPRAHRRANSTWRRTNKMDVNPVKRDIFVFGYFLKKRACRTGEELGQRSRVCLSSGNYYFMRYCYG